MYPTSKCHINNNPENQWSLAKDLNVSEGTIRMVVHEDIICRFYDARKGQFMSGKTK